MYKDQPFFAGWYQERELVKNENGNAVDKDGNELEERDGSYYYPNSETKGEPAYTYSDYWDFEKDTIDYSEEDGEVDITLYAGWVPYSNSTIITRKMANGLYMERRVLTIKP